MSPESHGREIRKFDEQLLKWSLANNQLLAMNEYAYLGPRHVPCGNDCGKIITIGDEVVVVRNKKGHVRGIYCSERCQQQHLWDFMARRDRKR